MSTLTEYIKQTRKAGGKPALDAKDWDEVVAALEVVEVAFAGHEYGKIRWNDYKAMAKWRAKYGVSQEEYAHDWDWITDTIDTAYNKARAAQEGK